MAELYRDVVRIFEKLLKLQEADPPPILWEGMAALARFALLGLGLLAIFLCAQAVACAFAHKPKNALFLGLSCVVAMAVPLQMLAVPIAVAPAAAVTRITVQTPANDAEGKLIYGNDKELTDAQTQKLAQALQAQTCRRTLRRALPWQPAAQQTYHLVVTLKGDAQYQLLLTPQKGWRYFTENTGFLCALTDYGAFYKTVQNLV